MTIQMFIIFNNFLTLGKVTMNVKVIPLYKYQSLYTPTFSDKTEDPDWKLKSKAEC